ncbi:MAG: pyruvate formate-lyase activating enzyme, partial [Deltaproteobacteria bacterium]|nr:pyruvate formate-lyase activating enzyme [Deltaproteobacteria bacterium]
QYATLNIGDVDIDRLRSMIESLGVPFEFDIVGFCAQDHGVAPEGVSHLDFRHNLFKSLLDQGPSPHSLLYRSDEIPETFNRLRAVARSAHEMPTDEVYVMDSGMAAILGASMDEQVRHKDRVMIVDVATSHTVGATMEGHEIAGFFEYHTHDITPDRLEILLIDLADGKLDHDRILDEGGHGAYTRKSFGFKNTDIILATGPKRGMIRHSKLPFVFGSPLGDNMMTGTVGVLEAIRRRKGFDTIAYI